MSFKCAASKWGTTLAAAMAIGLMMPAPTGSAQTTVSRAQKSKAQTGTKAKAAKPVNNAVCPVSGEAIGSMGDGINVTYKGQTVTLCCKSCLKKFNANPDAYLKKAVEGKKRPAAGTGKAAKKDKRQKQVSAAKSINNAHCPVSGELVGSAGKPVLVSHNGYSVSLCCPGCKEKFTANADDLLQKALADSKRQ